MSNGDYGYFGKGDTGYQSQATVRSYQKMKADAEAGDPDAIKRYETTLAKRREEYHRKKGA